MFCMKCGQLLPDDARFCSRCRAATVMNTAATQNNPVVPVQNTIASTSYEDPDGSAQTVRLDECEEYAEYYQSTDRSEHSAYSENKPAADTPKIDSVRQVLVDAIDKLRESRSTRMAILGIIFAAALLVSLCAFASIENNGYTNPETLCVAIFSGAAALAFLISMFRVYFSFDRLIEEKEEELARYDFEYKGEK